MAQRVSFLRIGFWIGVSHRDATYRWPCANTFAVGQGWRCLRCRFFGGRPWFTEVNKNRDEWYWNWNLEHGHKNCLENDGCFFSKDSRGVVFSQKFGDKDFQYMCCTPKAKKSIWMCCHLQSIWIRMLNPNNNCGKCQGFDPTWVFLAFVKNDFGSKPELWVKLS